MDIFQLFLNHLAERHHNNIYQNIQQDADYLEATMKENELNEQYKKLNLSDEHQKVMTFYIDCISPLYTIVGSKNNMMQKAICLYDCGFPHGYAVLFFPTYAVG